MVWHIRASTRVVSLLSFPGHQAAFDVDLPATGACAVYTVSGANHFVVLPTLTITFFPITIGIEQLAMSIGKSFALLFEVPKPVKKFAHRGSPDVEPGGSIL
ncbi:hypothetical protein D3C75_574260 [compost metagenome]